MITEDYVSFEVAKLLKEKGFNEPCYSSYKKGVFSLDSYTMSNIEFNNNAISAPTFQMAMKWLREVHNVFISISIMYINNILTYLWVRKNEKMLPPLNHLDECNGSHYTMQLSIYARLVERILEIPCVGLGLCHIGSPFVLNKYGQPLRDKDGYHIDENGEDIVNWYRINFLRNEADAIFNDRLLALKALKAKQPIEQPTLFD